MRYRLFRALRRAGSWRFPRHKGPFVLLGQNHTGRVVGNDVNTDSFSSFGLTAAGRLLPVLPCANLHRGLPAAIGSDGRALGMLSRTR